MTITKKYLQDWEKSAFMVINADQKRAILERFGVEPESYEWTDQDIAVQVRSFLECGEFVKQLQHREECMSLTGVDF